MDKEARGQLLRKRLNPAQKFTPTRSHTARGLACSNPPAPTKPTAPLSLARVNWRGFSGSSAPFGLAVSSCHQVQWVKAPDERKVRTVKFGRKTRESALTQIADKSGKKLPVVIGWDRTHKSTR